MIKIDGSYLEGGGQIVRTALAFSTLTSKPIRITNIRQGRSKPGLKFQHIFALKALKELCNANTIGDELGSESLVFKPKKLNYHNLNIDIGTAGSITLLLQALLPVLVFSDKKIFVKVTGGTDTKFAQSIDYFVNVFLPHLKEYAQFTTAIEKRGYYPKGGGRFVLGIEPKTSFLSYKSFQDFVKDIDRPIKRIKRGNIVLIKGVSHASKDLMNAKVAERAAKSAQFILSKLQTPVKLSIQYSDTLSTGSGITLWAIDENQNIIGSDCLGRKGLKAEIVGQDASKKLYKLIKTKACTDKYIGDQILPYLALSSGKVKTEKITSHTKTNMHIIEKFINSKFKIKKNTISLSISSNIS